jgi:nucleoside-diphosphate-sugar epimerase
MTHILVTGSNGIIGRHICRLLSQNFPNIHVTSFKGDITIPENVAYHFQQQSYDYIIHLASLVAVSYVDEHPAKAYAVNVGGTVNLLDCILSKQQQKPLFFLASSAHIYQSKQSDISENDAVGSHTLYGRTKYMAEQLAHDICMQKNIPLLIGRIFSFYDTEQKPPFLYPNIMHRLNNEDLSKPFELHGADSMRDMSKACDIANLILQLIFKNITGTLNIASGKAIKIRDFVQSLTYKKLDIIAKGTVNHLTADITQLNKVLND